MPTEEAAIQSQALSHFLASSKPSTERLQPYLTLNDGNKMPMFGLGTWNAQGKELKESVKAAIECGYRHIDTASNYKNEHLVGEAINECLQEGICTREDLFVTTKVWNNSHSRGSVPLALADSLKALKLTYVDLYLIHYPIGYKEGGPLSPLDESGKVITTDVDYVETWLGMEDAQKLGLTKSIGVSNFSVGQLARLLCNCSIVPAMNQVECHPYLSQSKMLKFCRHNGIGLTAYSPLGSPGRLSTDSKEPRLIEDPLVKSLAQKYRRPAAHVLISYQIERGVVVIPKAIQKVHLQSNLDALSLKLSPEDLQKLESLNRNHRFMLFERCLDHKFYPFSEVL